MSRNSIADGDARPDAGTDALLEVDGLTKHFPNDESFFDALSVDLSNPTRPVELDRTWVRAVDDVSFDIREGEILGLVGESGCGKSTLAQAVLNLIQPTAGEVRFKGEDLSSLSRSALRNRRQDVQMVFQDPQSSLNPRMKVGQIIEAPMKAHDMLTKEGRKERTAELLEKVGLEPHHYNRYPHEFSGGQRQRVNLARALSVDPDFIVCDEPVSALDVSIQASVLNTMKELQEEFGLTYLFITHDLSVVRYITDRVAVMYLGNIVEIAETTDLFEDPQHPYTKSLLNALPIPDPEHSQDRTILEGEVPSPSDPPSGCRFRTRCPELIAPDDLDVAEDEWAALLSFVRAVERRTFDPLMTVSELESAYFGDVTLDGRSARIVDDALSALKADDVERAAAILDERITMESVCATEDPGYGVESEAGRYCACHRVTADER
ncbi:ABC transporter ATP-binding protein [Halovivax cerinus]|uniref:ABC transporter ATP-binding protein n=1 Tax=Halovivax cerinus TaxID=1487865 RepID=A0ABD5NTH9_9EURY|nr:oligopeptide/dipeptide ABC transporter ATP-binding protein [Halovivax cerinus]